MRQYFLRSLENITKYGDTDIFPFPIENHIFHDCINEVADLLLDIADRLAEFPPANHSALVPIGYTGFAGPPRLILFGMRISSVLSYQLQTQLKLPGFP